MINSFTALVGWMALGGLLVTGVRLFLELRKIWLRKHLRAVAESISLLELLLGLGVGLLGLVLVQPQFTPALNQGLLLAFWGMLLLIGAGVWVARQQKINFFGLLAEIVGQELKDLPYLFKNPQARRNRRLRSILQKIAGALDEISAEEVELMTAFARGWGLRLAGLKAGPVDQTTPPARLHRSLLAYLRLPPPTQQVAELVDILKLRIHLAEESPEDEAALANAADRLEQYVNKYSSPQPRYELLLVPQNNDQVEMIRQLVPDAAREPRCGGSAFVLDRFYTKTYAEAVCQKYMEWGLFSVWQPASPTNN